MPAESDFVKKIKIYLKSKNVWFIKYWAGNDFTKAGIPDILACHKGEFIAIEVKAKTGKPSLLQIVTLRKIRDSGGRGILLYPKDWENFKNFIESTVDGALWYIDNIKYQDEWFNKLQEVK